MPSGVLGQAALAVATNTTVYTVPSGMVASFNINAVNRGSSAATVRIAIASSAAPTDAEWIEFDASIPANGVLERTGIVAHGAERVVVQASTANVSVNVYGYEE